MPEATPRAPAPNWRTRSAEVLGLGTKTTEYLCDAGLRTLEDIAAELPSARGDVENKTKLSRLIRVKGVGPKTLDKIEDAIKAWQWEVEE